MTDISDICNLSDEERMARRKFLRDELMPKIRGRDELPDGLALVFDDAMRGELDAFVAFENECCPGVGFRVKEAPESLRLEITGVDPGAAVFADFVAAAQPPSPASGSIEARGWLRVVRSAGLGAVGAFFVFCVVPIGLVAVVGAQLAEPLGMLDNLWVMGAGTVLFAGLLWRWERRREAARATSGDCGC